MVEFTVKRPVPTSITAVIELKSRLLPVGFEGVRQSTISHGVGMSFTVSAGYRDLYPMMAASYLSESARARCKELGVGYIDFNGTLAPRESVLSTKAVCGSHPQEPIFACNKPATTRRKTMRMVVLAIFFAASAFAQNLPASPTAACGSQIGSFKVKLDESQHTPLPPDPGKARIYFIHDAGTNWTTGYPTVKIAVDGTWAGANHGNSYFSISLDPGEHHVCATLQSSLVAQRMELAHLTAASETVYYYRTRLILSRGVELLELDSIDNDQGRYLIASFPLSVSNFRK